MKQKHDEEDGADEQANKDLLLHGRPLPMDYKLSLGTGKSLIIRELSSEALVACRLVLLKTPS